MKKLNNFSVLSPEIIAETARAYGTPLYLYDEALIKNRCLTALSMPNPYGLTVRYAMKANSSRTLLNIISNCGLYIDASSLNEVRRALLAGIPAEKIILTTQEVPEGEDRKALEDLISQGVEYNVCSLRQLHLIADYAAAHKMPLSIRVHPGVGSGESATRNTGDNYSCFGVHLSDVESAVKYAADKGLVFSNVHVHIGSGSDPVAWLRNIDLELGIIERYFHDCERVSFGGGFKEARMPAEKSADIIPLGEYASTKLEEFYKKTGRKLKAEIEPGTFITANSGYAITRISDKKSTGTNGFNFIITDGGMEINARPLFYGSQHPFYIVSPDGVLRWSEFYGGAGERPRFDAVIAGKCCESGDCQTLNPEGLPIQRTIAEPMIGDYLVIGGVGAYCSAMTPFNYNSHTQIPEVLFTEDGTLRQIRRRQTLEQMLENEM